MTANGKTTLLITAAGHYLIPKQLSVCMFARRMFHIDLLKQIGTFSSNHDFKAPLQHLPPLYRVAVCRSWCTLSCRWHHPLLGVPNSKTLDGCLVLRNLLPWNVLSTNLWAFLSWHWRFTFRILAGVENPWNKWTPGRRWRILSCRCSNICAAPWKAAMLFTTVLVETGRADLTRRVGVSLTLRNCHRRCTQRRGPTQIPRTVYMGMAMRPNVTKCHCPF